MRYQTLVHLHMYLCEGMICLRTGEIKEVVEEDRWNTV